MTPADAVAVAPRCSWNPSEDFLLLPGDGLILASGDGVVTCFDMRARELKGREPGCRCGDVLGEIWPALADLLEEHAIAVSRTGPVIVYANPAALRQTGYQLGDVLWRSPRLFQGPDTDRAALRTLRDAMCHWQPARERLLNYRKDGSPFWVEIDSVPLEDSDGWYTYWASVQRECRGPAGRPEPSASRGAVEDGPMAGRGVDAGGA